MADFLLEIGTEEIPDWMIEGALVDLRGKFQNAFATFGGDALRTEATPRRLMLLASNLVDRAADVQNVLLGPYLSAGEKAAEGFARKNGVAVAQLARASDAKGERYVAHQLVEGKKLADALCEQLTAIVTAIQFPKSMVWTGRGGVRFIRPIRWIVALLDDAVVPFEVAGVSSSNTTRGHRVLGAKEPVAVTIASYEQTLRDNFVLVRAEERWARIEAGLPPNVRHDPALLETLVYLTEYPSVIQGSFDPSFLELPREILSTVMRHHQRYFSLLADNGGLAAGFAAVTNTDGDPDGLIRQGNERVLRARFNDARFFWQVDQKRKLAERVVDLEKVTFQAKLGSYKAKTERVVALAGELARLLGADVRVAERAALLAKCDLTTDMVKEFTELQGVVGGLYAQAQGEGEPVAQAIYDHYKPVSMEGSIPRTPEGQAVAIADKLDTLGKCFEIGLVPTGSKDPFALRRAAQGLVKILFEAKLDLPLFEMTANEALRGFLRERVDYYLREQRGYAYDEVNAVLAAPIGSFRDLADRAEALQQVRPTEDFEPLAASFKRIKNIVKQAGARGGAVDVSLLAPGPERELYNAFERVRADLREMPAYRDKLARIASLRPQVDLFFDKILVNDSNPAIRQNRLALLSSLLSEFSSIADFSEIVTAGANA